MKPIERVKIIIESKHLSISGFEKKTGMSNNSIQTAIKKNANLKDNTLNTIINTFPDIDPTWLLTGKGEMTIQENTISSNDRILEIESLNKEDQKHIYTILDTLIRDAKARKS